MLQYNIKNISKLAYTYILYICVCVYISMKLHVRTNIYVYIFGEDHLADNPEMKADFITP